MSSKPIRVGVIEADKVSTIRNMVCHSHFTMFSRFSDGQEIGQNEETETFIFRRLSVVAD